MVMLRISLISDHHHHHHHCHHLWHWSLSCLAYGSDKYNFKWCNIVRFCLCIIIIIIIISFIYVRPTYSRSCIWNTRYRCMWKKSDWWTQPRWEKKTILPFFSFTCYDFKFFFSSLQTIFKALPTFRSTYMGHVAAAWTRSHQWCVSLTPNNTWVAYIA